MTGTSAIRLSALALTLILSACDSGSTPVEPESSRTDADAVLLAVEDLPDGYTVSPPQPAPEVSAAGSVSVAGCDALLNRFRDGGAGVRFEAGTAGPFLVEELAEDAGAPGVLRDLAARCAAFTDTDAAGETTGVTVTGSALPGLGATAATPAPTPVLGDEAATPTPGLGGETPTPGLGAGAAAPRLGDEVVAVRIDAIGGAGDDAYTLSGYLIAIRVGGTTCTIVHFGQPGVDPAETETITRAAVRKLQRRQ